MSHDIDESMSQNLFFVDVDLKIVDAYRMMQKNRVRHLPVTDKDKLIGILSDRDVQRAVKTEIKDFFSAGIIETSIDEKFIVRDFMSWPVSTLASDAPVVQAINLFREKKISSLVVTENEKVVGILTTDDLLGLLEKMLEPDSPSMQQKIFEAVNGTPIGKLAELLSNSGI